MSAATKRAGTRHTPATARIQARLERSELQHLRELCAEQAEQIERLQREVWYAEDCAEMWQRGHERLSEHLSQGTSDAHCIGLTQSGELLVINTGALQ